MTILILDDIKFERELTRNALEILMDDGWIRKVEIIEASDKAQALSVDVKGLDLAVLDVILESATDGLVVAKEIQEKNEIPIVLVTGSYSISDLPALKDWIFAGNGRDTAVDICPKIGYGPHSLDEYATCLHSAICGAISKIGKGNNTAFYEKLIQKSKGLENPTLMDSLKVVFKQYKAELTRLSSYLVTDKTLDAPWLFDESQDLLSLLHNMRKPAQIYSFAAELKHADLHESQRMILDEISGHAKGLFSIINCVQTRASRYSPNGLDIMRQHKKILKADKKPFPGGESVKLVNRIKLLEDMGVPYLIIRPDDSPAAFELQMKDLLSVTGRAIARSAGSEDVLGNPLAGFYSSSEPFGSPSEISSAAEFVRQSGNRITDFCFYNGLMPPDKPNVIVEPFHDAVYSKGMVLEHPNFPGTYLAEFMEKDRASKGILIFSADGNSVKRHYCIAEELDKDILIYNIRRMLAHAREVCKADSSIAAQMEFCFDSESRLIPLQFRYCKPFDASGEYAGVSGKFVSGRAASDEMVAFNIRDAEDDTQMYLAELKLVEERAAEDGLTLCMAVPDRICVKSGYIASFPANVGLVITEKGNYIQSHDCFNLLVRSKNLVSANYESIGFSPLDQGQKLVYSSDGHDFLLERTELGKEIMQDVRKILNRE